MHLACSSFDEDEMDQMHLEYKQQQRRVTVPMPYRHGLTADFLAVTIVKYRQHATSTVVRTCSEHCCRVFSQGVALLV